MVKVPAILCSALVLLAITYAVTSDTNISYQIGEFNSKLTHLQGRLDLFDYITDGNVSVLQHRVEINESQCIENVTKQLNETNARGHYLMNKMDSIATDVSKLEGKLNALATTVSNNISKYAENVNVQLNGTNVKLNDLVDKFSSFASVDTRMNSLESKFNALESTVTNLATTVINLVGRITEPLLNSLTSCEDAFARPLLNRGSGVYNILLNGSSSPFDVYCMADPKGGLPWTVVQRRVDGAVDFYRNWTEYQRGFGDLDKNFFIGLDKLHWLTAKGEPQELWVMLTDINGISAHAYYDRFAIGNEAEKYPLNVLGKYSGDAGDSLTYHKFMKFSTYDKLNDLNCPNCAEYFKSAWWFRGCDLRVCHSCHLNGVYGTTNDWSGLNWNGFPVAYVSKKYAHMAIRPAGK